MLWLPTVRLDVLKLAVVPEIVPVPTVLAPSLNVTVPVAPLVTVAVNVTVVPNADAGLEEVTFTDDEILLTVSKATKDVAVPTSLVKTARTSVPPSVI